MSANIMEEVLDAFFPGKEVVSCKPHGSGHIHRTYKVEMTHGSFLLQQFNQAVFPDFSAVAQNIKALSAHLSLSESVTGLKALIPVPNAAGGTFVDMAGGGLWRMFEFIQGGFSIEQAVTERHAFEAGKAFGRFASALQDFPVGKLKETIPGFHDSVARWRQFGLIRKKAALERLKKSDDAIQFLEVHHGIFEEIQSLALPIRAVHNDAKIGNVLFSASDGAILAVTDWDTVMPGLILADFGDLVRSIASPVSEDDPDLSKVTVRLSFFGALCDGFLEEAGAWLTTLEKKHLVSGARWIILEQGMRFLHDYLAGDTYYPVKYADHNLVRARNQFALFASILESGTAMEAKVGRN